MPFLRHSEVGSTTIWLRMYWHTGAHEVKVHFSCAPLGYTCTGSSGVSDARFICHQAAGSLKHTATTNPHTRSRPGPNLSAIILSSVTYSTTAAASEIAVSDRQPS